MLAIAGASLLVTAWEIFDGFRRARRAGATGAATGGIAERGEAVR
jgi:hypothetical protein